MKNRVRMEPEILRRGKNFHRRVEHSWLAQAEGKVIAESAVRFKPTDASPLMNGRMDLLVHAETGRVVVEVVSTDWDRVVHVDRLLARHRRRLFRSVQAVRDDEEVATERDAEEFMTVAIVYPRTPSSALRTRVESYFAEYAVQVAWFHDVAGNDANG